MTTRPRTATLIPLAALLALAAGCETEAPKPKAKVDSRKIINKTTYRVLPAEEEVKKGAVVIDRVPVDVALGTGVADHLIVESRNKDVIAYEITNNAYPKDAKEFVEVILKANNNPLPELPYYLEYGYDAAQHKLVILEYPERKKDHEKAGLR